jgi:hypothetical protein
MPVIQVLELPFFAHPLAIAAQNRFRHHSFYSKFIDKQNKFIDKKINQTSFAIE